MVYNEVSAKYLNVLASGKTIARSKLKQNSATHPSNYDKAFCKPAQ